MPLELNSGLVVAGAYAIKIRRTLFAQLSNRVKQDKELSKEIARASAELNRVLYNVIVEELKSEKGDVVRVRVQYDLEGGRINWHYDTLKVELFKRVPDESVSEAIKRVLETKLAEVRALYATAEVVEEAEKALERIPVTPLAQAIDLTNVLASAIPIGETLEGGLVFQLKDSKGSNIGIADLEKRGEANIAEAIVLLSPRETYRLYVKLSKDVYTYSEKPDELVEELKQAPVVKIDPEEAKNILKSKMELLI
ncbi:MAG: DUF2258 domain-containing protein [Sulfolobales archaeon]|nr:DUF2258 domain-containing protein [Sulfolobales archaeon]MCX8198762.1 DUF2258 domain-containing protein [Sulfolobales archaeon]MDW8169835.1 DUF2258 domain-containing protein [Desulfurococcaceae archaeon]